MTITEHGMTDIRGVEIVGYEEACYLKDVGFNWLCTGYYHCDEYYDEEGYSEDERYECVGWRGLYRNTYSLFRVAAPTKRAAELWYKIYDIKPFKN
jgi:hypothetical protein